MMPPSSRQMTAYWAPPSGIRRTSLVSRCCRNSAACGPEVSISPMWETSKTPARSRTAVCSSRIPAYCTGISQPANGTSRAPAATWRSWSGVRWSASAPAAIRWPDASSVWWLGGGAQLALGDHGAERLHDRGVELRSGAGTQLVQRLLRGAPRGVRALGGHGVEGVRDRDDARAERDLVGDLAVRVAAAVPALVRGADEAGDAAQRG